MDFDDAIVFCRFPDRQVDILDEDTNAGTTDGVTVDATAQRRGLLRRKAGDAIDQLFINTVVALIGAGEMCR